MAWNGIGIGWPNATSVATPVPANVYYNILSVCSGLPDNMSTNLVNPSVYTTGDYVYSTTINDGVLLGDLQLAPGNIQVEIIGPTYSGCPVTALESYVIVDCITGQEYTSGYYYAGNFALGDRVYTKYGNYGWVQNITTAQEGDQDEGGFSIGYVADRCNDCNVGLWVTITKEDVGTFNINLFAKEMLSEVNFQSSNNELDVYVNYYAVLSNDEDPDIIRSGSYLFEISSYNVPSGTTEIIGTDFIFNAPESYSIIEQTVQITSINFDGIALGPYDTGWDKPNRYVTNYGNVWTMTY